MFVLWLGRCEGHTRKVNSLPPDKLPLAVALQGGRSGEVEDLRKRGFCAPRCVVTRASLCVRVPRVLSEAAELQRAVALVRVRVLHRDVVLCVSQASLPVSSVCFVSGALRGSHTEGQQPPNPKGQSLHQPLGPTSWAPVQRESRTVRPISLALRGSRRVGCQPPASASPALLNASAADESATSTEVHKASSQRASTEAQTLIKRQRC